MCGIAGIAGRPDPTAVERMCRTMVHRGPDHGGTYSDPGVSLGMRRLAIIDRRGGRQPMANEDRTVWVVFNGEIYNFQELRSDLAARGHALATASDTEVIVHLYEEHGPDLVAHLRGMFALAVWDVRDRTLLLARDRMGIKPLFYAVRDGRLLFASEINALLAADPGLHRLDPAALDAFLTLLYVPSPATLLAPIRKLPPAHILTFRRGTAELRRYWEPRPATGAVRRSARDWAEEALHLLREAVRMRLVSEVPLGAFLSGGMDSATLVALMTECGASPVETFTIGYGDEHASYDELASARIAARALGTRHHEFVVRPDVVDLLPDIVRATGEPFADSSAIPTYLVCRETRRHVTVALSGVGGDELFFGYPRYLGARLSRIYDAVPRGLRRGLVAPLAGMLPESTASRNLGGWVKRFADGGALDPVERYLAWIGFVDPALKADLYSPDLAAAVGPARALDGHRRILAGLVEEEPYPAAVRGLDLRTYLPDDLLFMADAMSMAHSLEVRVPFCDHRLVEFVTGIPPRHAMLGWRLKGLLKNMMADRLPPEILGKKKQGFMVPIGPWFRRDLRPWLRDLLLGAEARERGFFRVGTVERLLEEHFQGRRVRTHVLWALATLEVWCRLHLDRRAAASEVPAAVQGGG